MNATPSSNVSPTLFPEERPEEMTFKVNEPEVAVVILNWNGKGYLEKFLPFLMESTYRNKRIIVADNASSDDSVSFLQQHYPGVTVIANASNEGFAKGYNTALRQVQADYYVLLNSDVEVTPGWIEPVIELMQKDPAIGACQPKILAYNNKEKFEYAGASGGWIDNYGYPFARGRVFDECETDKGQYDNVQECFWATGAAMFVRANVYHELKGLDEYFFAHQEEIDLCWRLQLSGYRVFVQPASAVFHVGGGTLPKGNSYKTFLNFRNGLIMMYKNLPRQDVFGKMFVRILLDIIAAWKAVFSGDGGYFFAVAKAHFYFGKWVCFHQNRSAFVKAKKLPLAGWYRGSIVWDYFIKRKKTFSEIINNK